MSEWLAGNQSLADAVFTLCKKRLRYNLLDVVAKSPSTPELVGKVDSLRQLVFNCKDLYKHDPRIVKSPERDPTHAAAYGSVATNVMVQIHNEHVKLGTVKHRPLNVKLAGRPAPVVPLMEYWQDCATFLRRFADWLDTCAMGSRSGCADSVFDSARIIRDVLEVWDSEWTDGMAADLSVMKHELVGGMWTDFKTWWNRTFSADKPRQVSAVALGDTAGELGISPDAYTNLWHSRGFAYIEKDQFDIRVKKLLCLDLLASRLIYYTIPLFYADVQLRSILIVHLQRDHNKDLELMQWSGWLTQTNAKIMDGEAAPKYFVHGIKVDPAPQKIDVNTVCNGRISFPAFARLFHNNRKEQQTALAASFTVDTSDGFDCHDDLTEHTKVDRLHAYNTSDDRDNMPPHEFAALYTMHFDEVRSRIERSREHRRIFLDTANALMRQLDEIGGTEDVVRQIDNLLKFDETFPVMVAMREVLGSNTAFVERIDVGIKNFFIDLKNVCVALLGKADSPLFKQGLSSGITELRQLMQTNFTDAYITKPTGYARIAANWSSIQRIVDRYLNIWRSFFWIVDQNVMASQRDEEFDREDVRQIILTTTKSVKALLDLATKDWDFIACEDRLATLNTVANMLHCKESTPKATAVAFPGLGDDEDDDAPRGSRARPGTKRTAPNSDDSDQDDANSTEESEEPGIDSTPAAKRRKTPSGSVARSRSFKDQRNSAKNTGPTSKSRQKGKSARKSDRSAVPAKDESPEERRKDRARNRSGTRPDSEVRGRTRTRSEPESDSEDHDRAHSEPESGSEDVQKREHIEAEIHVLPDEAASVVGAQFLPALAAGASIGYSLAWNSSFMGYSVGGFKDDQDMAWNKILGFGTTGKWYQYQPNPANEGTPVPLMSMRNYLVVSNCLSVFSAGVDSYVSARCFDTIDGLHVVYTTEDSKHSPKGNWRVEALSILQSSLTVAMNITRVLLAYSAIPLEAWPITKVALAAAGGTIALSGLIALANKHSTSWIIKPWTPNRWLARTRAAAGSIAFGVSVTANLGVLYKNKEEVMYALLQELATVTGVSISRMLTDGVAAFGVAVADEAAGTIATKGSWMHSLVKNSIIGVGATAGVATGTVIDASKAFAQAVYTIATTTAMVATRLAVPAEAARGRELDPTKRDALIRKLKRKILEEYTNKPENKGKHTPEITITINYEYSRSPAASAALLAYYASTTIDEIARIRYLMDGSVHSK